MIAKCVVVLAIVAQISGHVCNCGPQSGYASVSSSGNTRNIVAQGKYPVALSNCGPCLDKRVPVTTSHVQAPVQVKPTVRLPACIPAPKTVSHTCTCYKTVMRPTVQQQYVTVPSIQRYIETTHQPVVENIHYEATPVNCPDTAELMSYGGGLSGSLVSGGISGSLVNGGLSGSLVNGGLSGSLVNVGPSVSSLSSYPSSCQCY